MSDGTHSSTYVYRPPQKSSHDFSYTAVEQKFITNKLTHWVTADLQPFTIVKQEQFQGLVYTLDLHYNLPFALTTDIWSSTFNNTAFLGIIMHCITNDWKIKKCLLDFISLERSHSAELILTKLTDVLQEFNISDRIISLTTDNGSNMLACGRELASEVEAGFLILHLLIIGVLHTHN
ncbi:zinc finger BED domain-containing protein 1-like [Rhizophagus clarus]|uniref:Zinc finger BED domain-containing protein 1-like n=1 Tax=Rhizophagus clarus TaxID=94130 RepID=A0A8H3L680_9GLOM|nr:zinc finger BED domain-containing protein 1-like [Rhizophagus clarus]